MDIQRLIDMMVAGGWVAYYINRAEDLPEAKMNLTRGEVLIHRLNAFDDDIYILGNNEIDFVTLRVRNYKIMNRELPHESK